MPTIAQQVLFVSKWNALPSHRRLYEFGFSLAHNQEARAELLDLIKDHGIYDKKTNPTGLKLRDFDHTQTSTFIGYFSGADEAKSIRTLLSNPSINTSKSSTDTSTPTSHTPNTTKHQWKKPSKVSEKSRFYLRRYMQLSRDTSHLCRTGAHPEIIRKSYNKAEKYLNAYKASCDKFEPLSPSLDKHDNKLHLTVLAAELDHIPAKFPSVTGKASRAFSCSSFGKHPLFPKNKQLIASTASKKDVSTLTTPRDAATNTRFPGIEQHPTLRVH